MAEGRHLQVKSHMCFIDALSWESVPWPGGEGRGCCSAWGMAWHGVHSVCMEPVALCWGSVCMRAEAGGPGWQLGARHGQHVPMGVRSWCLHASGVAELPPLRARGAYMEVPGMGQLPGQGQQCLWVGA